MSDENGDKVRDRLERLKAPIQPKRRRLVYVIPMGTLLLGLGLGVSLMWPRDAAAPAKPGLPTSTVTEFQEQSGLAGFTTTRPTPAPVAPAPAPKADGPDPDLARLSERLDAMTQSHEAAQRELQDQLAAATARADAQAQARAEAEAERQRLEAELLNSATLGLPDQAAAEDEARRLADLEARRQEAADLRQRRITSPIVAFSAGGTAGGRPGPMTDAMAVEGMGSASEQGQSDDFLRAGAAQTEITRASRLAHPGQTVVQGTVIEAALETAIDTSLPGNVAAIVSQDVWSMDMSQVLIPRGSKLYGRYSAETAQGQRRVMIAWDRILRADGMTVDLEGYGTDPVGRAGLTGRVENHTLSRFGAAAMVSVIGALPAVLEAAAGDGDEDGDRNELGQIYAGIGQSASGALGNVMAGSLSRGPTITIPHGQVVKVRVNQDMEIFP